MKMAELSISRNSWCGTRSAIVVRAFLMADHLDERKVPDTEICAICASASPMHDKEQLLTELAERYKILLTFH